MKKVMTFKEVLEDPQARALVDAIEDTLSSLRGRESDSTLQDILERQVDDLEARTGYRYQAFAD